ncbi:MAG: nucleoside triphosphate pyrophosphohydrolase [Candidatus Acidiferrales bacterium]
MPPRKTIASKSRAKARAKSSLRFGSEVRAKGSGGAEARIPRSGRDKLAGQWFEKLVALQARLRAPNGCPWDREQTHESLRKFLIEETYEVLDAMEKGDSREFSSELGDLLLQIVFHSILAEETGRFTIADVIESVHTKMVRRHPHVFGKVKAKNSSEVLKNWEQIKAEERAESGGAGGKSGDANEKASSILAGIPRSLPGVLEAYQLTRRASHIGFDWDRVSEIFDKFDEEKRELEALLPNPPGFDASAQEAVSAAGVPRVEEEVGDLLFAAVNVARFLGVDPELALKKANRKFKRRFRHMEAAAKERGQEFADLPRERKEELWNFAKSAEGSGEPKAPNIVKVASTR